jgi:hypothetical protein
MNTKLIASALLLAATAVPAFADDAAPAPANNYVCLQRSLIDGWGSRDDHSMIVDDRFGRKFLLTLSGLCSDLKFSFAAGVHGFGGGGMCVERGDHIVMRGGGAPTIQDTCWVSKVQRYTQEMAAADRVAREAHQPLATY